MRASGILCLLFALTGSSTASAAQLDWMIGFDGVRSKSAVDNGVQGTLKYVDVLVHSNETPAEAAGDSFVTHLQGYGPSGSCSVFIEKYTKVKPGVWLLRFQIFYPKPKVVKGPKGIDLSVQSLQTVDYRLKARLEGVPDQLTPMNYNNTLEITFKFPVGGNAPACVKLQ